MLNIINIFVIDDKYIYVSKRLVYSSNFKIIFYEKVISIKNHKK